MEEQPLMDKVKDLEFLLNREKMERKNDSKQILHQVLETQEGLERLIQISKEQDLGEEARSFIQERFSLVSEKLLQILFRSGAVKINSMGQVWNGEYHEVVEEISSVENALNGQIVRVDQDGYIYQGDVLRMAKVAIYSRDS